MPGVVEGSIAHGGQHGTEQAVLLLDSTTEINLLRVAASVCVERHNLQAKDERR